MSKRVRQNWPLLHFLLQKIPARQLKSVLCTLSPEQVDTLGEIAINVLYGTLAITDAHKRSLKHYTSKLEYIGDSAKSIKKRKAVIRENPQIITLLSTAAKPLLKGLLQQ